MLDDICSSYNIYSLEKYVGKGLEDVSDGEVKKFGGKRDDKGSRRLMERIRKGCPQMVNSNWHGKLYYGTLD